MIRAARPKLGAASGQALLALEDGTFFFGRSRGAPGEAFGEAVFNTAMTGYQEVATDPSYLGQIVVMTHPQIGNYGVIAGDEQSDRPRLAALVAHEICAEPSNSQAWQSLPEFLSARGVLAIDGVDTRALTLLLRDKGSLRCAVSTRDLSPKSLLAKVQRFPKLLGADLAAQASCAQAFLWSRGSGPRAPRLVVYDFGVKYGLLRRLAQNGARVAVVPARTAAEDVLAQNPDGVILSSGPGDPSAASYGVASAARLAASDVPMLGVCLGHQLLALAFGGRTFKMKFGHHGANHPVKDLATGRVMITSHNHGFAVDAASLPKPLRATHVDLNDGVCEGLTHVRRPIFSVQFHPEAAPGPRDGLDVLGRFLEMVSRHA